MLKSKLIRLIIKKTTFAIISQPTTFKSLNQLKKNDFKIVALEQDKNSVDYKKVKCTERTAFLIGNEVRGISKQLLSKCDVIAEIPMKGKKESLNVSVATGVFLFGVI